MQKTKTIDASIGKWRGILSELGLDQKYLANKHGPCPICNDGVDRYRWDNKDGSGSYFCSQCGPGYGIQLLMRYHGWDFAKAASEVDRVIGKVQDDKMTQKISVGKKMAFIKRTLSESRKVTAGDPVATYLKRRTGVLTVPPDIRYHPSLYYEPGVEYHGMLAIMRGPDGKGVSVHRTYLTEDGEKANVEKPRKIMSGMPISGSAVRLSAIQSRIGIAEGIETAMSAGKIYGMPVWAATSAILLEQFTPPDGVDSVIIFGDNDSNFTGQAAAYSLAKRLSIVGLSVSVRIPEDVDRDWADCIDN